MTEWRHVRTIGTTELRRRWRSLTGNPGQLLALVFAGLFGLLFVGIVLVGSFLFGTALRTGGIEAPLDVVAPALAYLWIFVLAFGGYRAYATALRPDRLDGVLTTVSHRELLGGLLFAEALLWGIPGGVLVGLAAILFAAGVGSPVAAPVAFGTVGLVAATALAGGALLALAVRNTGVRSRLLTRIRTVLLAAVGLAYFWLLFTSSFGTVLEPLYRLLAPTPVGWFGDLFLLGTAADASPARAAGVVAASALFLAASASVLSRLAALLWYADGVSIEHERTESSGVSAGGRLDALLGRPVAGVALRDWKRARRAPITLSYVVYPVFLLIGPVMTTVRTGTVGRSFPLLVVLSGAWVTGTLFSLNVLGSEGAVLPSTLLSDDPGRRLVAGHAVAAAVVGTPLTLAATVALGIASPHAPASVLTLAASAVALTLSAPAIASGTGVVFPRFEAVSVSRSRKAIVPSLFAIAAYSILLAVAALPTLAGHSALVGHALESWFAVPRTTVRLSGTLLSVGLGLGIGLGSALYAVRAVDGFRFD